MVNSTLGISSDSTATRFSLTTSGNSVISIPGVLSHGPTWPLQVAASATRVAYLLCPCDNTYSCSRYVVAGYPYDKMFDLPSSCPGANNIYTPSSSSLVTSSFSSHFSHSLSSSSSSSLVGGGGGVSSLDDDAATPDGIGSASGSAARTEPFLRRPPREV